MGGSYRCVFPPFFNLSPRICVDVLTSDHCIETLRQNIICHSDPTLTTFKWLPRHNDDPPHLTAEAKGRHQCVDWRRQLAWVRERAVPVFEDGVVFGPDEDEDGGEEGKERR